MAPKSSRQKQLQQLADTLKERSSGGKQSEPEATPMPPPKAVPKNRGKKRSNDSNEDVPASLPAQSEPSESAPKPEPSEPQPKVKAVKKAKAKKAAVPNVSEKAEPKKQSVAITGNSLDAPPEATWENFEQLMDHFNMTPEETTLVLKSVCGPDKRYEKYWASYKALPPPSPPASGTPTTDEAVSEPPMAPATGETVSESPAGEGDIDDDEGDDIDGTYVDEDASMPPTPDMASCMDTADTLPMEAVMEPVGLDNGGSPQAAHAPGPARTNEVCDIGQKRQLCVLFIFFLNFSTWLFSFRIR